MNIAEMVRELEVLDELFTRHCLPRMGEQVQELVSKVVRNPVTQDGVLEQEFTKGLATGIEQSSYLPRNLLEVAKQDLEREIKEAENAK